MESATDYLLVIRFDASRLDLEESVQSFLYLTASAGSSSDELGIIAYFADREARQDAHAILSGLEGVELHDEDRLRVDWLDLYQQSLEPMLIGKRFIVAPDVSLIPDRSTRLSLVIPQEQAFGTGSHETTSLCIEQLEGFDCCGKYGLDVGAGSGILALAMLRLGARRVVAFDNDPDALGALHENRQRNAVSPSSMPIFIGGLEAIRSGGFEVVTMNIVPEVILPLLPRLVTMLAPGAMVILSGVLSVRAAEVTAGAEKAGLRAVGRGEKGEWWAGAFELRQPVSPIFDRGVVAPFGTGEDLSRSGNLLVGVSQHFAPLGEPS